jgi:PTH2 family peptidyl-tRNA hydrolase
LNNEYKQVIVVRSDLKMGKGKIAAQVAHAAVLASERAKLGYRKEYSKWLQSGQAKIVVRVESLKSLLELRDRADNEELLTTIVEDRGLTQLPEGTITCLSIGPGRSSKIDSVTGNLKLL